MLGMPASVSSSVNGDGQLALEGYCECDLHGLYLE